MFCPHCGSKNVDDISNCQSCGKWLGVRPQSAALDLLQLNEADFVNAVAEGLSLIAANIQQIWTEAEEIAQLGKRRAVGILQALAEEEAGKALLLFDAIRCPNQRKHERRRLIKSFDQHLAKGIYAYYYSTRPANLDETHHIIEDQRRLFYRQGEYGEYIAPNPILFWRENRLYVDYARNADASHTWRAPIPPDILWGDLGPSEIVDVVNALSRLRLFTTTGLAFANEFWEQIEIVNGDQVGQMHWLELRAKNLEFIEQASEKMDYNERDLPSMRIVVERLLYPLYSFDLSELDNFRDLPGPDRFEYL